MGSVAIALRGTPTEQGTSAIIPTDKALKSGYLSSNLTSDIYILSLNSQQQVSE